MSPELHLSNLEESPVCLGPTIYHGESRNKWLGPTMCGKLQISSTGGTVAYFCHTLRSQAAKFTVSVESPLSGRVLFFRHIYIYLIIGLEHFVIFLIYTFNDLGECLFALSEGQAPIGPLVPRVLVWRLLCP